MTPFASWLWEHMLAWCAAQPPTPPRPGRTSVVKRLAEATGLSRSTLNNYLHKGHVPNDGAILARLAVVLGPEVYAAAGYIPADPRLLRLLEIWHTLTPEQRARLVQRAEELME